MLQDERRARFAEAAAGEAKTAPAQPETPPANPQTEKMNRTQFPEPAARPGGRRPAGFIPNSSLAPSPAAAGWLKAAIQP